MTATKDIYDAIVAGDQATTDRLVAEALAGGLTADVILAEGLVAGMTEVGNRFECGEYFVGDMMVSARAMKAGLARLRPLLAKESVKPAGKVVIGTVQGDLHDIGKNLVAVMLEGAGFQVFDLGVDVKADRFVAAAREHGADVIALSALLTTTMTSMKSVVDALDKAGLHGQVKILVGGAAVTPEFAQKIGADGFAADAAVAAARARQLVGA
jgi:5-methyltetrahydrofolate--homocysteine methyltransferase